MTTADPMTAAEMEPTLTGTPCGAVGASERSRGAPVPESLIDHIRRHTTIQAPNDAADAAQAVAEWCDRRSRSARLLPAMALRSVARIIQAEVDREEKPQRHECTDVANAFGGYRCTCGMPWLTNGCMAAPQRREEGR